VDTAASAPAVTTAATSASIGGGSK
jgi:hypothetical protein